jgi:hypothetical protein
MISLRGRSVSAFFVGLGTAALLSGAGCTTRSTITQPDQDVSFNIDAQPNTHDAATVDANHCVVDDDCAHDPAGHYCDRNSQTCRACLPSPAPNTCAAGMYCDATFACVAGCSGDVDCTSSPHDGGGADAGVGSLARCDLTAHRCVQCLGDPDCPSNLVCSSSHLCAMGCSASHACPTGQDCCDGTCTDLFNDATHCGSCLHSCSSTGTCCAGVCEELGSDVRNCGACHHQCVEAYAMPSCTAGTCGVASCYPSYGDCDHDPSNGCETLLTNDVNHCGGCGTVCASGARGTALCTGGTCTFNCTGGYLHCSSNPADGCEVDPQSDPMNCGVCGHVCTGTNVCAGGCTGGACSIGQCCGGFADCDGVAANGCEVPTGSDPYNCGGCFHLCPSGPNAVATCSSGTCSTTCSAGFSACGGTSGGCPINLHTDAMNCGTCGHVCPSAVNGTPTCTTGVCGYSCMPGYRNCSGVASDGCNVNLRADANNCGSCGTRCMTPNAMPACNAGSCAIGMCNAGYLNCDGLVGNGCEIVGVSDNNNCGTCGNVCTGGATCVGGTCTLVDPFPSTGVDGVFAPMTSMMLAPRVYNFMTINIPSNVTITVSAGNGVLDLRATGDIVIAGTINLTGGVGGNGVHGTGGGGGGFTAMQQTGATMTPGATGQGGTSPAGMAATGCGANGLGGAFGGGSGTQGNSTVGGGGGGGVAGGGGGLIGGACVAGTGGGGGATAGAGGQAGGPPYDGQPGQTGTDMCSAIVAGGGGGSIGMSAATDLGVGSSTFVAGSGGGGGSAQYSTGLSAGEGGGGGGGGAIRLSSPTSITVSGSILVDGGAGGNGSDGNATCTLADGGSGGGGGSGGVVYLAAPTLSVMSSAVISAQGGAAGLHGANCTGGNGGTGGLGRIRISASLSSCTLAGTFRPALVSGCTLTNSPGHPFIAAYPR